MSSRFPRVGRPAAGLALLVGVAAAAGAAGSGPVARALPATLRVCADPNNLPFSNDRLEGFENRLAELVARELGARLAYVWWPQRRGFFRETLGRGRCDVVMGVPSDLGTVLPTRPYYRSTYAFVTRAHGPVRVRSFDDPALRRLRIGVQVAGDATANTPPVYALARRDLMANVIGYSLYADYSRPNPPARVMEAVASGEVDLAVVWGPLAGYFATRERVPLYVVPVSPAVDAPGIPLAFSVSMGVRKGDDALRRALDAVIERRRPAIERLLDAYGVPRAADAAGGAAAGRGRS